MSTGNGVGEIRDWTGRVGTAGAAGEGGVCGFGETVSPTLEHLKRSLDLAQEKLGPGLCLPRASGRRLKTASSGPW